MIQLNISDTICEHTNENNVRCKYISKFNRSDGKLVCGRHKNISSKRCLEEGCDTRPNFAKKGDKAEYCNLHKKDGMIDVKHKRCLEECCDTNPAYATKEEKAKYCNNHYEDGMKYEVK